MGSVRRILPDGILQCEFPAGDVACVGQHRRFHEEDDCECHSESSILFLRFMTLTQIIFKVFIAYCTGNIVGPQLFFGKESPSYPSGFLSMMICFGVGLLSSFLLRFYLIWENRRRDCVGRSGSVTETHINSADKTDKDISGFRYVY